MLDLRRGILQGVRLNEKQVGVTAFRKFYDDLHVDRDPNSAPDNYRAATGGHADKLDHYFRFTYHLVRFVDERFPQAHRYEYVRLFRAQLSAPEQMLIALNAIYGAGRDRMPELINRYSLLHNLPERDKAYLRHLGGGLTDEAFVSASERAAAAGQGAARDGEA